LGLTTVSNRVRTHYDAIERNVPDEGSAERKERRLEMLRELRENTQEKIAELTELLAEIDELEREYGRRNG